MQAYLARRHFQLLLFFQSLVYASFEVSIVSSWGLIGSQDGSRELERSICSRNSSCASIPIPNRKDHLRDVTYPVFDILFSRLLPAEPAILPGPQGRIILVDALDNFTSPSKCLSGGYTVGLLGLLALDLGWGLPATSLSVRSAY